MTTIARVGIDCTLLTISGAGVAFGTALSGWAINAGTALRLLGTKTETVGDLTLTLETAT